MEVVRGEEGRGEVGGGGGGRWVGVGVRVYRQRGMGKLSSDLSGPFHRCLPLLRGNNPSTRQPVSFYLDFPISLSRSLSVRL